MSQPDPIEKLILEDCEEELVLPDNLVHLELNFNIYPYELKLPKTLKYLKLRCTPKNLILPEGLEQLYFYYGKTEKLNFPESLTHLQLPFRYPHELPELPNLKYLSIGAKCPKKIYLNDGLEEFYANSCLKLDSSTDCIEDEVPFFNIDKIPDTLQTLQFPLELYDNILEADYYCIIDLLVKDNKENYLPNFPNLKTVNCYDNESDSFYTTNNDEGYSEDTDEIKKIFKENPQVEFKPYYSNYIKDYSGYDVDDIIFECGKCKKSIGKEYEMCEACKNCYCMPCAEPEGDDAYICLECGHDFIEK